MFALLGLSGVGRYIGLGLAAAVIVLGAVCWDLWASLDASDAKLGIVTKDRDAQATEVTRLQGVSARQQETMRRQDETAQATIRRQQADNLRLAAANQATADDRESLLQQIEDAAHAHSTIIVASAPTPVGWDPAVAAGMRCLRGVQLGRDLSSPDCRIQAADGAGGSGPAGDPARADPARNPPRPDADQQHAFLAFAWRLRDWGASCYADKRAIAESQAAAVEERP